MPVLENLQVSLADVLDVKKEPLKEWELWGLLYKIVETVQDLLRKEHTSKDSLSHYVVTPDNLFCTAAGDILLRKCLSSDAKGMKCWFLQMNAVEYSHAIDPEKTHVYMIGKTLIHAAHHNNNSIELSPMLKTMLQAMCQVDDKLQMTLQDIAEVCRLHSLKYMSGRSFSDSVVSLHEDVFGSVGQCKVVNKTIFNPNIDNKLDSLSNKFTSSSETFSTLNFNITNEFLYDNYLLFPTPKERWKSAFLKITNNLKLLNMERHNSLLPLQNIYERLMERWKILEVLKLSVSNEHLALSDVLNNYLGASDTKPKSLVDFINLLQRSSRQQSFTDSTESCENISCDNQNNFKRNILESFIDDFSQINSDLKPYYNIDKVALGSSCFRKKCSSRKKSFIGPEFVIGHLKPHSKLKILDSNKNETFLKPAFTVIVTLLNGEHLDIECTLSVTGKQVYQLVANSMKLQEQYLFGLTYKEDGECIFIDQKQKLLDVISARSENFLTIGSVIQLYFQVRFYLDNTHLMRSQYLRHLYYLQLRKDVLKNDFACDFYVAVTLGALSLQAELGNYSFDEFGENYFLLDHYLPHPLIHEYDREKLKLQLIKKHASLKGIPSEAAELKFIQEMMKTSSYGYHFHKVLEDKNNLTSVVWLGINSKGVDVFECISRRKKIKQKILWKNIQRISYTSKYLCITQKKDENSASCPSYRFFASILLRSHYLFTLSMLTHKFYLKLKSISKVPEMYIEDFEINHCFEVVTRNVKRENEVGCDLFDDRFLPSSCESGAEKLVDKTDVGVSQILLELKTSCSEQQFEIKRKGTRPVARSASAPETLKISISLKTNSTFVKNLHDRFSSTMPRASCKKQDIKFVRLFKNLNEGLGIVVTCGNTYDTVLHGAFVEAVTPGGVVDLEGNISPGDQILSVNGTDVRNHNFLEVVDLLKLSNSPIELVVAKTVKSSLYSEKESIESPFTKTNFWKTGNCHSKDITMVVDKTNSNGSFCDEAPIPKPRKKWIEREKLNFPDLTLNHAIPSNLNNSQRMKDCITMRENSNIPDIIPSQVKSIVSDEDSGEIRCESVNSEANLNYEQIEIDSTFTILPGELYHVVLDKKGGSLGLNIYQGADPIYPHQRNIYIHSTIPGRVADLNGKITSGDKLLKVNGMSLENLSYQEVVTKLRESPQVVQLVLEKRSLIRDQTLATGNDRPSNNQQNAELSSEHYLPMGCKVNNTASSSTSLTNGFEPTTESYVPMNLNNKIIISTNSILPATDENIIEDKSLNNHVVSVTCTNSVKFPSLGLEDAIPTSIPLKSSCNEKSLNSLSTDSLSIDTTHCAPLSDHLIKDPPSTPLLNNPVNGKQCKKSNSDSGSPSTDHATNNFLASPTTKALNTSLKYANGKPQSELTSYKSTPNLAENSDDEESSPLEVCLYRNSRSTDCLVSSPYFLNPHLALIDLYHNYPFIRSSKNTVNQMPTVPIRKKKLRKLEDVYNFCNHDNTFIVNIRKSSRGLGISISGGREMNSKDYFSQLIRIRKLYPLQPALECGQLQLGDVILEVNGTNMIGLTNTEGLEILRCAPPDVILKVFRPSKSLIPSFSIYKEDGCWPFVDSCSSSSSSSLSRNETKAPNVETGEFEVTLMKIGRSLGFTILQCEGNAVDNTPPGIYVKALVREPAVSDGRIQPGDRILKVNGVSISSMSNMEAISFIRTTPETVVLNLYRTDPPLSPSYFEEEYTISKPLRWEAVELINDRGRDNADDCNTLKRKLKRKLDRTSHAPSDTSAASESASSTSSGQEYVIKGSEETAYASTDISEESQGLESSLPVADEVPTDVTDEVPTDVTDDVPGLQRNQRPKSLDVLNTSDRIRLNLHSSEDSFHRQASVMCPSADRNEEVDGSVADGKGEALLKWRGSTMPDSETVDSSLSVSSADCDSSLESCDEPQQAPHKVNDVEEELPVPMPRTTSAVANDYVETVFVLLDRGWHGRLGFSLFDAPSSSPGSPRKQLPAAAEVKAVHSGSLAEKDGRIKVGDRVVEVNYESLLGKSAAEVIDILRKTRGTFRMMLCRLKC